MKIMIEDAMLYFEFNYLKYRKYVLIIHNILMMG
jgi:hypothetical protein